MKKVIFTLVSIGLLSSSAFAVDTGHYNLEIKNSSSQSLYVKIFENPNTHKVKPGQNKTINNIDWNNNVSINYSGKWSNQGFLTVQRFHKYYGVQALTQDCATGRSDLKAVIGNGIDKGDYVRSTGDGNCSQDNGVTCLIKQVGERKNAPSEVKLSVSGQSCSN